MTDKPMTLDQHMDIIMDHFDFERVRKVMEALDWRWFSAEEGIPKISEMRQKVRKLMRNAYDYSSEVAESYSATGGFHVTYYRDIDKFIVEFVVTDWVTRYD